MRRIATLLLTGFMVLWALSGCAKVLTDEEMFQKLGDDKVLARASEIAAKKETPPPATTMAATTATTTTAPTQTPEPKHYAPIDLLGEEFNPFSHVAFPQGYNPYGAKFDTGDPGQGERPTYSLYLTAEGDPGEIVKFVCQLAGFTDEKTINTYVAGMNKDGFCSIDSTTDEKGMNIFCGIKKTKQGADFDRCDDVDGCRLELIAMIDKEGVETYRTIFTDNYTYNIFGSFTDQFTASLVSDRFMITVNTQKSKFTQVSAVHAFDDPARLITELSEGLKYDWYDDQGICIGLSYGRITSGVKAYVESKTIIVDETLNDAAMASCDYVKPEVSLTSLGFSYSEQDVLCIYEKDNTRLAIYRSEWGERKDKSNIEFFTNMNGYNFLIWYIKGEDRYTIQVDKGKSVAKYEYYGAENRYAGEFPDKETVQQLFKKAFGDAGEYQLNEAIDLFNKYINDTFSMTMEKLYELPLR